MAKLAGLTPMFNRQFIKDRLNRLQETANKKTLEILQYHGEVFVNKARSNRTYDDDTGNLRSSIGYIILYDGKIIRRNFRNSQKGTGRGSDGQDLALNTANEVAQNYPNGWVLIGVAGMNYAAAVEALGYDVITGAEPKSEEIKKMISEIQF